ncbi:MAG: endopeptidase La [Tissierellia bacterium]|nr:endopeptidase La [Tissierellia bacterium]
MSEKTNTGFEIVETFPVIPLRNIVVFPQMVTHFDVGREISIAAIEQAELEDSRILLLTQKDYKNMEPNADDIYDIGTVAVIRQMLKLPQGLTRVLVEGEYRVKVKNFEQMEPYIKANVTRIPEKDGELSVTEEAGMRLVKDDLENYIHANTKINPVAVDMIQGINNPDNLIDMVASYLPLSIEDSQKLLSKIERYDRIICFHEILQREIELLGIENKINERVKKQMGEVQREYYLREQLKAIRQELGDDDDEKDADNYSEKIKALGLEEESEKKLLKEADKLNKIHPSSAEYGVLLNYLDWVISLPWKYEEKELTDINRAEEILDEDHYGLKDVKKRILEFLAVRRLTDSPKGPILCLVGPPGVGKTSIVRSIARALDKKFVSMRLGGVTDEAQIRGHRRTYIGALPGAVINNMKKAGTVDPVFLLDEIDKVGNNYRGDPASGLLEVLDPEQNSSFTDHYIDLPYDLSHVLFVTTANTISTIPRPLLDRMEVIKIEGYTPHEKFVIATDYLLPKQIKENGIPKDTVEISDNALRDIIDYYTRESGVRNLEREIQKILRKCALQIVTEKKEKIRINAGNLDKYLGPKRYIYDVLEDKDQVGVVTGLAWTEVGGTTLTIEANCMPGKGKIQLTGKLGDVMKESAAAGISYIRSIAKEYDIDEEFYTNTDIHIHIPEGAMPKDGPSAGITMATAVLSALTGIPVKKDIAMTGEITLRGRVLPIGGLKEKLLAAQRMGCKTVLIPKENEPDLQEIEAAAKAKLNIIAVSDVHEVFDLALDKTKKSKKTKKDKK